MTRRTLPNLFASVLISALVSMGVFAWAQLAPLPGDARFDAPVTLQTGFAGVSLREAVLALATSVGLSAIVDDVPADAVITYNIQSKPFRQVWNLVLSLNNLDYALLENDLVVVGTAETMARLSGRDPVRLEQRIYRLSNARAVSTGEGPEAISGVADILRQTLGLATGPDAQQATPPEGETQTRLVNIAADPRTNSIIVTAPAAVQEQIVALLPELDRAEPQVNVQVRIQEMSTSAAADLGINLNAGIGSFAATVLEGGLNFVFNPQSALTGLNLGAVLNTLERQGLSRRVDDSTITVINNAPLHEGNVVTTPDINIPPGFAVLQSGGQLTVSIPNPGADPILRELDYGVSVGIRPRIGADGRIILEVIAAVRELVTPPTDAELIDRSNREIRTIVTLEPGQSVVLGGLLQNSFLENIAGVPVLSSIPLIGGLFRTASTEETNSELFIILTANILE
ncbi:hypothetical protein BH24DEI1_BH24DEI1_03620 [soil metagenome]|jgi:type II secretory pathway component GspD/PulD (secretin)|nr:hypothetical protein [Deinococcota bacterium]